MMELISALSAIDIISDSSGDKISFLKLVSIFENIFGVVIAKPYDKRARLAIRKREDAPFMDKLRKVFIKKINST